MSDYISREALIKAVEGNPYVTDSVKSYVRCTARSIPSADVRPVVRCRECKHWSEHPEGYLGVCSFISRNFVMENGYCAWGERKEADHE